MKFALTLATKIDEDDKILSRAFILMIECICICMYALKLNYNYPKLD